MISYNIISYNVTHLWFKSSETHLILFILLQNHKDPEYFTGMIAD